jgi:hypothetical protein
MEELDQDVSWLDDQLYNIDTDELEQYRQDLFDSEQDVSNVESEG